MFYTCLLLIKMIIDYSRPPHHIEQNKQHWFYVHKKKILYICIMNGGQITYEKSFLFYFCFLLCLSHIYHTFILFLQTFLTVLCIVVGLFIIGTVRYTYIHTDKYTSNVCTQSNTERLKVIFSTSHIIARFHIGFKHAATHQPAHIDSSRYIAYIVPGSRYMEVTSFRKPFAM